MHEQELAAHHLQGKVYEKLRPHDGQGWYQFHELKFKPCALCSAQAAVALLWFAAHICLSAADPILVENKQKAAFRLATTAMAADVIIMLLWQQKLEQ